MGDNFTASQRTVDISEAVHRMHEGILLACRPGSAGVGTTESRGGQGLAALLKSLDFHRQAPSAYYSQNRWKSSKLSCLNDLRTGHLVCELFKSCHSFNGVFYFHFTDINTINVIEIKNGRYHVDMEIVT
jgi:hypothetical protein